MKMKLITLKRLKMTIILAGVFLIVSNGFLMLRAMFPVSQNIEGETMYSESYLGPNTYIVNSVQWDSTEGWKINAYVNFEKQLPSYFSFEFSTKEFQKNDTKRLDLFEGKNFHLLKIYALYYLLLICLWTYIMFHLYLYISYIENDKHFSENAIIHLYKCGRMISISGFLYYFGIELCTLTISIVTERSIRISWGYNQFLILIILVLTGTLIQVLTRTSIDGHNIKTEQDLTV